MASITVGEMMTRIKQRTDLEKSGASGFVSDSELIRLIQLGTARLQNDVMRSYEYWLARYQTFTTVVNQLTYPFTSIGMADLYKPLGIGITAANASPQDSWLPLEQFDLITMNLPAGGFFEFTSGFFTNMRYLFMDQAIELRPVKSAQLIGVYYVPRPPQFANSEDVLPAWIMPGWEEYVVAFAAWMIAAKERTGVATHREIWQLIADDIKNCTPNRDTFRPHTVVSARGMSGDAYGYLRMSGAI